jgi:hypothetical protein
MSPSSFTAEKSYQKLNFLSNAVKKPENGIKVPDQATIEFLYATLRFSGL